MGICEDVCGSVMSGGFVRIEFWYLGECGHV